MVPARYWNAIKSNNIVTTCNKGVIMIKWCPPKPLYVKLNTDGAFKDKKIAGCGGVIRGTEGEWLGGFAKCVGFCSAFVAELWGVVEGLRYAYRLGFKQIELNIDSEAVVRVIKNGTSNSAMGSSLLKHIKNLLAMDWIVEISHTYREANKCADVLANIGCSLSYDVVFYDSCPDNISDIYVSDTQGSSTPRLVAL
jgi:ribonuclease HI